MTGEHWDLTAHVRGAISEALVAEAIYQRHTDTILHSPRHRGYDVSTVDGDMRVDAKVASIVNVELDGSGLVDAIEWDAGQGAEVLHDSASHLGLVVLDSRSALKLFDGTGVVLQGDVVVDGRVFLVPADVAREKSSPIWNTRESRPSKGRFRYLRLGTVARYEVAFRGGLTSGEKK